MKASKTWFDFSDCNYTYKSSANRFLILKNPLGDKWPVSRKSLQRWTLTHEHSTYEHFVLTNTPRTNEVWLPIQLVNVALTRMSRQYKKCYFILKKSIQLVNIQLTNTFSGGHMHYVHNLVSTCMGTLYDWQLYVRVYYFDITITKFIKLVS
jgi:hypothetical protein